MAVPFNMPEDQNEVEVIISQLQVLLTKLRAALRRSGSSESGPGTSQQAQSLNARVRTTSSLRSRPRSEETTDTAPSTIIPPSNLPDLLSNLAWLASSSQEEVQGSTSHLTVSHRRRTDSESSCSDHTKISAALSSDQELPQDWNQEPEEPESPETKSLLTEVFFSKFVPGPMSAPIWTAMICVVGWHLFRAR